MTHPPQLSQVIRIDETSDATFDALMKFGKAMKKSPSHARQVLISTYNYNMAYMH